MLDRNIIFNEMIRYAVEPRTDASAFLSIALLLAFWGFIFFLIFSLIRKIIKKAKFTYTNEIKIREKEIQLLKEQNELLKQIANNKGE